MQGDPRYISRPSDVSSEDVGESLECMLRVEWLRRKEERQDAFFRRRARDETRVREGTLPISSCQTTVGSMSCSK